jgi:hypothetical protein
MLRTTEDLPVDSDDSEEVSSVAGRRNSSDVYDTAIGGVSAFALAACPVDITYHQHSLAISALYCHRVLVM